jgi:hypothetical protein
LKRAFATLEAALGPQPSSSTMPHATTCMTGSRSRPTTMTSGSPPTCVTCSSRFRQWPRA